jgi:peptidoglycan/xylan/chitin deacetylase (PgdA/CDA1 family)
VSAAIPILMYHQVTPAPPRGFEKYAITPGLFREHMDDLGRRGYQSIGLDELMAHRSGRTPLPRRPVVITFDDGYQDCVDHAVPVLEARGLTATFFVVAGLAGRSSEWLRRERSLAFRLFDWPSARRLEASGFRCGAHGWTHARMTELTTADCRQELAASRRRLEDELGREVLDMAYPHGRYDERTRGLVAEAGYRSACSVRPGLTTLDDDPLALRRVHVEGGDSVAKFRDRLAAGEPGRILRRVRGAWRRMRTDGGAV